MKIIKQEMHDGRAYIEVEFALELVGQKREAVVRDAIADMRVPGFRKGKVPRQIAERNLNMEMVEDEAYHKLMADAYPEIIRQTGIEPVDYPKVNILRKEKDQPFAFSVDVAVYPEFKLPQYKGLKVEKKKVDVSEADIDAALKNIQKARGQQESTELNDAFVRSLGIPDIGDMTVFRKMIRENMEKNKAEEAEADFRDQILDKMVEQIKVAVPDALLSREIDLMREELRISLERSHMTMETYLKSSNKTEAALNDELRPAAEKRVKAKLVLRQLAKEEKIEVSSVDVDLEFKNIADRSGRTREAVEASLGEGSLDYIQDYLLRRKTIDFLVNQVEK